MEDSRFDNFHFYFKLIFICPLFVYRKNFSVFFWQFQNIFSDKQIKLFIFSVLTCTFTEFYKVTNLFVHSFNVKNQFWKSTTWNSFENFQKFSSCSSQVAGSTRHWERRDRQGGPKWVHAEKIKGVPKMLVLKIGYFHISGKIWSVSDLQK